MCSYVLLDKIDIISMQAGNHCNLMFLATRDSTLIGHYCISTCSVKSEVLSVTRVN